MSDDQASTIATPDFHRRRWRDRLRRWRLVLISALVVVLIGTATWFLFFSSVVTVRGVEVTGNTSVAASAIERAARAPVGTPLARADLDAVQARVEAIPAVKSVSVSRSWPHTIRIEVTERVPVAVVSRTTGLQAVDLDGVLFGSYRTEPEDLPLIRTAPGVTAEVLAEAAKVVQSLRSDIAAKVRYVDVSSIDKITLRLAHGPQVAWGSADDSELKAQVLSTLLANLKSGLKSGPKSGVDQIDVSVPGRPTTK